MLDEEVCGAAKAKEALLSHLLVVIQSLVCNPSRRCARRIRCPMGDAKQHTVGERRVYAESQQ